MIEPPRTVPFGEVDPDRLSAALRDAIDFIRQQPVIEFVQRTGPVQFPIAVGTELTRPRNVFVNARPFPDTGANVAATGIHWTFNGDRGEIEINAVGNLTAGTSYQLDIAIIGERA